MARRLIGTAVTDANGEATITYTGTGAGQLNVVAESGTFVSETFSVLDALMYDEGTSDKSSDWSLSSVTYTVASDGILLDNQSGANRWSIPKVNGSASGYITSGEDYCMEVDIKNNNATQISLIIGGASTDVKNNVSTSDWTHIKFYTDGNTLYVQINDGTPTSKSISYSNSYVQFRVGNGESYYFKNLKLYKTIV